MQRAQQLWNTEILRQWPLEQMSSPCQNCHSDSEMDSQHEQTITFGVFVVVWENGGRSKGSSITATERRLQEVWKF